MAQTTATNGRVRSGVLARVQDDAALDGAGRRTTAWLLAAPVLVLALLAVLFLLHRPWYYQIQIEDRPIEWAQFAMVLLASVAAVIAGVRFARAGNLALAGLMVLVALGAFGLAGEEISWGQRVFGLVTPAEFAAANHQDELNIHNVNVGFDVEDLFLGFEVLLGLAGAGLSVLARRPRARLYPTAWWLIAPPLVAVPGFVAMVAYQLLAVPLQDVAPLSAGQEGVELLLYFSLAVTAAAYVVRAVPGRYELDLSGRTPVRRLARGAAGADLRPVVLAFAAIVVLTVVFAILSAHSGIDPGNLPGNNPEFSG